MFEELINKMLFKAKIESDVARGKKDAKYTIVVTTVQTEPGYNIGISRMNAFTDFDITYIETATKKVMAKGFLNNVQGAPLTSDDYDPTMRIKECYAKCGKVVGKAIVKALKK